MTRREDAAALRARTDVHFNCGRMALWCVDWLCRESGLE